MKAIDKVKQIPTIIKKRKNKRALEIEQIKLTAVYSYMDELSAQGYDFINKPTLS